MSSLYDENGVSREQKKRLDRLAVIFSLAVAVLVIRLFYLQVIMGGYYSKLAAENATRVVYLDAPRGEILSSDGHVFVNNEDSLNIAVVRGNARNLDKELRLLASLIHVKYASFIEKIKHNKSIPAYEPVILVRNISMRELAVFENNKIFLKGFFIAGIPIRHYPYKKMGAQVFGYVGLVSSSQLKGEGDEYLHSSDIIGDTGLEYYYQKYLHGKDGEERIVVDSEGNAIGKVTVKKPFMGSDLYTTLDFSLERLAYKLLKGKEGAVVAVDPQSGKILAIASSPSFNPFYFSRGISSRRWNAIVNNDEHPLQDKAIQNALAPGSTFKAISALAGLSLGIITPSEMRYAGPKYRLGTAVFYNWNPRQDSKINLYTAIAESVDTYFYSLGAEMNIDELAKYAFKFGLGKKTGVDLPGENPGFIPTKELVKKIYHSPWYKGSTLSAIIGQSYDLASPLQLVMAYSAIANGGYLYRPYILKKIVSRDGKVLLRMKPKMVGSVGIKEKYLDAVKKGLCDVVNKDYGTAVSGRINGVEFCGKTGTAQVISVRYSIYDMQNVPRRFRDNSWFVGFAPLKNPVIAVAVLDMHTRFLDASAPVIARKVVEKYLEEKGLWKPPARPKTNEKP